MVRRTFVQCQSPSAGVLGAKVLVNQTQKYFKLLHQGSWNLVSLTENVSYNNISACRHVPLIRYYLQTYSDIYICYLHMNKRQKKFS